MLKITLALAAFSILVSPSAKASFGDAYAFRAEAKALPVQDWLSQLRNRLFSQSLPQLQVSVRGTDGFPLAGATVLVGSGAGQPFAGNNSLTNSSGVAQFSDASLGGTLPPVTVTLPGYSSFTLQAPSAAAISITLPKLAADSDFAFLTGTVTGFPSGYPTTTLEIGAFLPAFRPEALMNFDPQQLVSSYTTPINVFGERQVPGNVLLPTQHKRYGFIPISLSKPDYTMPLSLGLSAHMAALAGALPISSAVKAIQADDYVGALNLATFTSATWTEQPVTVTGPQKVDLTVNHPINANSVTANLSAIPAGLDAIAVSLVDPSGKGNDFVPLDVKGVKSEDIQTESTAIGLGSLQDRPASQGYYVFTGVFDRAAMLVKEADSRAFAGSLLPFAPGDNHADFTGYLSSIKSLGVSADNRTFSFSAPANPAAGLIPDLVLLNLVSETQNDITKGTNRHTLWSVLLPGTATTVTLPDLGRPVLPAPDASKGEVLRWEVIALKASSAAGSDIQSELRNLRHVSSLSQKF